MDIIVNNLAPSSDMDPLASGCDEISAHERYVEFIYCISYIIRKNFNKKKTWTKAPIHLSLEW